MNARGIPTAVYQVLPPSPAGYPPGLTGGGGTWGGVPPGRGTPQPDLMGDTQGGVPPGRGTPWHGRGTPSKGYPPWPGLMGVPEVGYPPAGMGVPEVRYPSAGVPLAGVPPTRSDGEGVPEVGYPLAGVPPQPGLTGGTQGRVPPGRGTPWPGLMGGTQGGVPPTGVPPLARSDGGYPRWGTPQAGVTPQQGYPLAGPGWGTPPVDRQMDGWTDTCEKITFPSYYVRGRQKLTTNLDFRFAKDSLSSLRPQWNENFSWTTWTSTPPQTLLFNLHFAKDSWPKRHSMCITSG